MQFRYLISNVASIFPLLLYYFFTCYVLHLTLFSLVSVWIFSYEFQTNCKQYYSQNYIKKIKKTHKKYFQYKKQINKKFCIGKTN